MVKFIDFDDEIGKIIVICILSPIIIYKGITMQDLTLGIIGLILFIYDFYWYFKYKKRDKFINNNDNLNLKNKPLNKLLNKEKEILVNTDNKKAN